MVAGQPVSVHVPARATCGRFVSTPGRLRPRPQRDRRVRLAADARPEELGGTEPVGQLAGDAVDELAAAYLQQLGHAARDDGQVLAALRRVPGERAAVEDPVRVGAEQRRERRR